MPGEVRSIHGLERRGNQSQEDVLLTLAGVRRRLLGARLREAASPFDGTELLAELEETGRTLRAWVEEASGLTDDRLEHRTRELKERDRLVRSLEGVLTFMPDDDMPSLVYGGGGRHGQLAGA